MSAWQEKQYQKFQVGQARKHGLPEPVFQEFPTKENGVEEKSAFVAFILGLLLGPVGLWYKRNWAAGFAWLVMTIIFVMASGGLLAPVMWVGMAIHAAAADTRD